MIGAPAQGLFILLLSAENQHGCVKLRFKFHNSPRLANSDIASPADALLPGVSQVCRRAARLREFPRLQGKV